MTITPEVLIENWEKKFENAKNGKFNPITVTNRKIWEEKLHSNILAWLFNPNNFSDENFLKSFLIKVKVENKNAKFPHVDINNLNYKKVKVSREMNHIDLRIDFPDDKFIVILENKIDATQRENQLKDYSEIFNEDRYDSYQKLFIFHTFNKEDPNDKSWLLSNYDYIIRILENRNGAESVQINYFLDSYLIILKRLKKNERKEFVVKYRKELEKVYKAISGLEFSSETIDDFWLTNCNIMYRDKKEILEDIFQASLEYTPVISKAISRKLSEEIKKELIRYKKIKHLSCDIKNSYKIKIYSKGLLGIDNLETEREKEVIYFEIWVNDNSNSKIQFKMYINFKDNDKKIKKRLEILHKKALANKTEEIFNNTPNEINEDSKAVNIHDKLIAEKITLESFNKQDDGLEQIKKKIIEIMLKDIPKIEKILRSPIG
ncbi:MAG: PD-(D/E)XK nuclease family protein [Candidatus Heimdallarchaeota archaeon]